MVAENVAGDMVSFMTIYLPYIDYEGNDIKPEEKLHQEYVNRARRLWNCIRPKVEEGKIPKQVADDLVKTPDCMGAQAIFRHQLTIQLKHDEAFSDQIQDILY